MTGTGRQPPIGVVTLLATIDALRSVAATNELHYSATLFTPGIRWETALKRAFPIEFQAFAISTAIFVILFFFLTIASNQAANSTPDFEVLLPWINAAAYLLYVIAGLVSGMFPKRRKLAYGLIAGILAAAAAILVFGVAWGDSIGIAYTVVIGGVLGGIGGACAMMVTRKNVSSD